MDVLEHQENLFAISDAKLHGGMCNLLSSIYCKVLNVFPALEGARPRSRSGIQALCSLHISLEKARNLLQHCSECSKLYLAITGDSIVLKFEKTKSMLIDSLTRVEDIVPQSIGCQVQCIVNELEEIVFSLDPSEKRIGDDIIVLLQQSRKFDENSSDMNEIESFHNAASKLGITSSRTALVERRALKKLIEKARKEEEKRKESIVAYLLHLMRKYSKLFRSDLGDDQDSQGSSPCSPTVQGSTEDGWVPSCNGRVFDSQLSKINSFNFRSSFSFRPNSRRSEQIPIPPEELRCPISLQLMYDPVVIASGQTYERICIEKWFNDGHNTCPKTQQHLSHISVTPNYCVKGLIASWCEQNGVSLPDGPPESLDLNYWRLVLSDSDSTQSLSMDTSNSGKLKGEKVVPLETDIIKEIGGNEAESDSGELDENDADFIGSYEKCLAVLEGGEDLSYKRRVVKQIRHLLKDDEEARMFMSAHGFVQALIHFVQLAVDERDALSLDIGAMALFNLGVNNKRNKDLMLGAGVIPLLEKMICDRNSYGLAAALYLNLSCLEEAKPIIGLSKAVPFLIELLFSKTSPRWELDALHCLFNLSSYPSNIPNLLHSGIINALQFILSEPRDQAWTEKSIAVLINLASNNTAKEEIISSHDLITSLATLLDTGEPIEQEQSVSCLLIICNGNEKSSQMVLEEGVIPSLVSIQVSGTSRAREKAQKLLMHFKEQRQRDSSPPRAPESPSGVDFIASSPEPILISKSNGEMEGVKWGKRTHGMSVSRKLGRTLSLFRMGKNVS